jgi:hypothetical protein
MRSYFMSREVKMVQNRHFINGSGQTAAPSRRSHFAEMGNAGLWGQRVVRMADVSQRTPRRLVVGMILVVALLAFEVFNFDTTRYALRDLLGNVTFLSLEWATILAIAFCSIDFAGLVRMFTADRSREIPKEVWYLMGAWLLGATMNAIMTWWAITLTLLNHNFGNEVLSREQLLYAVPIFVAVLVWLTRILFIGAFTAAGDRILDWGAGSGETGEKAEARPFRAASSARAGRSLAPVATGSSWSDDLPEFLRHRQAAAVAEPGHPEDRQVERAWPQRSQSSVTASSGRARRTDESDTVVEPGPPMAPPLGAPKRDQSRVRQRPPIPNGSGQTLNKGFQARGRNR